MIATELSLFCCLSSSSHLACCFTTLSEYFKRLQLAPYSSSECTHLFYATFIVSSNLNLPFLSFHSFPYHSNRTTSYTHSRTLTTSRTIYNEHYHSSVIKGFQQTRLFTLNLQNSLIRLISTQSRLLPSVLSLYRFSRDGCCSSQCV